jgi:DnaJ domain
MGHRFFCGQQQKLQRRLLLFNTPPTTWWCPSSPAGRLVHITLLNSRCSRIFFSSFGNKKNDPFAILGIPPSSSYDHVKRAFVRLALETHPDRRTAAAVEKNGTSRNQSDGSSSSGSGSGSVGVNKLSSNSATHEFIVIRQAFEEIHHLRRGTKNKEKDDVLADSNDKNADWPDGDEWWRHDDHDGMVSNLFTFSLKMSHGTRQEVIHAYHTMGPGGGGGGGKFLDKGGYWEMARQMAEQQQRAAAGRNGNNNDKKGGDDDDGPILRLEAVTSASSTRRRRKR